MFVGMELSPPKLWWDLFCSKECCAAVYGDEKPERFCDAEDFKNRTGCELRHDEQNRCFNCGKLLELHHVYMVGVQSHLDDGGSEWVGYVGRIGPFRVRLRDNQPPEWCREDSGSGYVRTEILNAIGRMEELESVSP